MKTNVRRYNWKKEEDEQRTKKKRKRKKRKIKHREKHHEGKKRKKIWRSLIEEGERILQNKEESKKRSNCNSTIRHHQSS